MQIQVLLVGGAVARAVGGGAISTEVVKLQVFDGISSKVSGFVTVCRLYIRMKMREAAVEEQIQWILFYIQEESADIWKKNVLEDLEVGEIEFKLVRESF